jgi:hypothetical protein
MSRPSRWTLRPRPTDSGYALLRDEIWFRLSGWLKDGGAIPPDSRPEAELVAVCYAFDA